ncbi:MAG TPA: hypothetical protein DEP66_06455 [Acidimicrobiaceae bacterium]|nr:hypothetical protein [Acidimicrobiaceae bacterium]HCB37826.1 hypothetical protein [Acidimicrobiaceae bacterium]
MTPDHLVVALTSQAEGMVLPLLDRGCDPAYGARPLRRVIQRELASQRASGLLDGSFAEGTWCAPTRTAARSC